MSRRGGDSEVTAIRKGCKERCCSARTIQASSVDDRIRTYMQYSKLLAFSNDRRGNEPQDSVACNAIPPVGLVFVVNGSTECYMVVNTSVSLVHWAVACVQRSNDGSVSSL